MRSVGARSYLSARLRGSAVPVGRVLRLLQRVHRVTYVTEREGQPGLDVSFLAATVSWY